MFIKTKCYFSKFLADELEYNATLKSTSGQEHVPYPILQTVWMQYIHSFSGQIPERKQAGTGFHILLC